MPKQKSFISFSNFSRIAHTKISIDLQSSPKICRQQPINIIEGTETIDEVGEQVFEHIKNVASGDISTKVEKNKHREFQFWSEQTVTL